MKFLSIWGGLLALSLSGPVLAQSLSVEEILAKVDQNLRDLSGYQQLLADPDPARSSAAMRVMLESGDPELQKIALDYGLYSPNPAVKRKALEGFFATEPRVEVFVSGGDVAGGPRQDFVGAVSEYGGSVTQKNEGYFTWKLGKVDPGQKCVLDSESMACVLRITDSGVSVQLWGSWLLLQPDDEGNLTETIPMPGTNSAVIRIPIRQ